MKEITFLIVIMSLSSFANSQEFETFIGNYNSVMGVMDPLSCYCYNAGYLEIEENESINVCFEEFEDKVPSGNISVTGYWKEVKIQSNNACPGGSKYIFYAVSYEKIEEFQFEQEFIDIIEFETYSGYYKSLTGTMNNLSCYCYNTGYLVLENGEEITLCFDNFEENIPSGPITVTGSFIEVLIELNNEENNPCSGGSMILFEVEYIEE